MYITTDSGEEYHYTVKLAFKTTNNKAEYEALLARLPTAKALRAKEVDIRADSQVVVNQLIREYVEKSEKLKKYMQLVWEKRDHFQYFKVK